MIKLKVKIVVREKCLKSLKYIINSPLISFTSGCGILHQPFTKT